MAADPDVDTTELEPFLTDWITEHDVPGASLAVVGDDGRLYANGFGARDLDANAPATPGTLYGVGSITKSVTALAIARLVDAGDLAFDDPVLDHVPHYEAAPEVTIHDLLTHSSGYPSDGSAVALIARHLDVDHDPVPLSDDDDLRRYLAGAADERAPGRFFYNNAGYSVLARVVESVTGDSFADSAAAEVLDPLGLGRSTFDHDALADDDAMTPYRMDDGTPVADAFPFDELKHAPGGLVAPATELGRYLRLYLGAGELDGERLVDRETVGRMTDRQATRQTSLDGREQGYGYGWMVEPFLGDRLVSHGGSVAVSTAWIGYLEDAGVGVAIACNTAPAVHPTAVGMSVLALLAGEVPVETVPALGLHTKLERVTGSYESYRGIATAEVSRNGGGIELELSTELSGQEFVATPDSAAPGDLAFSAATASGVRVPIEFERTDDGLDLFVQRWRLHS
jgi:CubicO group peptidase (beta-lactamase class C family)